MILTIVYDILGVTLSVVSLCCAGIYLAKRNFLKPDINKHLSKVKLYIILFLIII